MVENNVEVGEMEAVPPCCDAAESVSTEEATASVPEAAEEARADVEASADGAVEATAGEDAAAKAAREAAEAEARRLAREEELERRSAEAVEVLGSSAGFVARAGVYYDASKGFTTLNRQGQRLSLAEQDAAREAAAQAQSESGEEGGAEGASLPADAVEESGSDYVDEYEFSRQVARLTEAVARQPLHREIYYKTLVFCQESKDLRDVEEHIQSYPEFAHAANNPFHFIEVLAEAGGLERFELDEEGEVVTLERKQGLTEDEVDDLVYSYAYMTTAPGLAVIEQHSPRARIIELLDLVPERKDAYIELLEFCSEEPRTYNEISQLFKGRDCLVRMVNGEPQVMQPSVFVDKLEAAAGVVWDNGWVLTEEGKAFLEELREA